MLSRTLFAPGMVVGISSGASTPEVLIDEARERLKEFGATSFEDMDGEEEHVHFALPRVLTNKGEK